MGGAEPQDLLKAGEWLRTKSAHKTKDVDHRISRPFSFDIWEFICTKTTYWGSSSLKNRPPPPKARRPTVALEKKLSVPVTLQEVQNNVATPLSAQYPLSVFLQ